MIGFRPQQRKEPPAPPVAEPKKAIGITIHLNDEDETTFSVFPAHLIRAVTVEEVGPGGHDDGHDVTDAVASETVPTDEELDKAAEEEERLGGPPSVVVRQRKDGDCGTAALANFLEMAYEDVYVAISHVDENRGGRGLTQKDLIAAAARLGRKLVRKYKVDLDEDEGILSVLWNKKEEYKGHYVALRRGLILDPSMEFPMDHAEWFRLKNGRPGTILVEAD